MEKKLLILHGWGAGNIYWQDLKKLLKKRGIDVLVPDLPGFGKEPAPKEVWGIDDYKNWVLKFAKENGFEKFNLLGHSFGGQVAAKVAVDFPLNVEKLILCAPGIIRNTKKSQKVLFLNKIAKTVKPIFKMRFFKNFYFLCQRIIYKISGSSDYHMAKGTMKEIFKKITKEDLLCCLFKIKSQTLILWGERDTYLSVNDAMIIEEKMDKTKTTLKIFPEFGHNFHTQDSEKLADEILKFLY